MFRVWNTLSGVSREARFSTVTEAISFCVRIGDKCQSDLRVEEIDTGDVRYHHRKPEPKSIVVNPNPPEGTERRKRVHDRWTLDRPDIFRIFKANYPNSAYLLPEPKKAVTPFGTSEGNTKWDHKIPCWDRDLDVRPKPRYKGRPIRIGK